MGADLRRYLARYRRERELPISYERLRDFTEVIPLTDDAGRPTLWDTVIYNANEMAALNDHTVWTWNAIGKRQGAWALEGETSESSKGFLLNHLISKGVSSVCIRFFDMLSI